MTKADVIAKAWVKERSTLKAEIERLRGVLDWYSRQAIDDDKDNSVLASTPDRGV